MSLLSVVTSFCERTNLPVPTTVLGSTQPQVVQIRALLEELGNDLAVRGDWEALTFETSFTTVATESQGAIATLCPNGFRHIKNETIWDRTNRLPIFGPITPRDWQANKALVQTGPRYQYRIRGGNVIVYPTVTAGYSWFFEYVTQNWITNSIGTVYKQYFTADTDLLLLPETLALQGLRWAWKKEKGRDYAEDMRTYEAQVVDALGHSGSKATINMGPLRLGVLPGIFVSTGSWPV